MIPLKTFFILYASALDAICESTLISDIGLQFFIRLLSFSFTQLALLQLDAEMRRAG